MKPARRAPGSGRPLQLLVSVLAVTSSRHRKHFFSDVGQILRQSSFALLICALTDILAGIFLGSMAETLLLLPGLIIIIPGAIALRGDIFASLGARMGTYLHTGQVDPRKGKRSPIVTENIMATLVQTLLMSLALAFLASLVSAIIGLPAISMGTFVMISVLAGLVAGAVLLVFSLFVSMGSFKKGWDPDNVTAPLITAAGDVVTIPAVFLAGHLALRMPEFFIEIFFVLVLAITAVTAVFFIPGRDTMKKILRQSIPILLICAFLTTLSGTFLESKLESLVAFSALLILVPPFNEEAGNLGAILASRLSSAAHLGTTKMRRLPDKEALKNIFAVFILVLAIFPLLGILVHVVAVMVGFASPGLIPLLKISLLSGAVISVVATTTAYYFTYFSYRIGVDPDNVVIPLITATMDIVGTVVLLFSISLFGII